MNSSVGQDLTAEVSQDALELHIEAMTDAYVESVDYRNNDTEAIVKLDKTVKFGSKRYRTMCGKVVIIASMSTTPEVPVSVQLNECTASEAVKVSEVTQWPADRAVEDDAYVTSRASESVDKEKTETFTETANYPADKRDLLEMLLPDLRLSLPSCSLNIVAEGIELNGSDEAVRKAMLEISEQVFRFKSCTIPLDRLLQSDKSQQQLQELFSKAGIQVVLSVRDDQLLLTAADDEQKSQASRILERNLHRSEIPVDDFHQEFLQSDQWKQFIDDLERNYTVTVEKETSSVVIDALGDCSEDVLKQVRDKLADNAQQSDDIHLTEEEWQLLKTYHQTEVEDFGRRKTG